MLFENDKIVIPNDDKLLTQLSMFEAGKSTRPTVIYKGANGGHDDPCYVVSFLADALNKYKD